MPAAVLSAPLRSERLSDRLAALLLAQIDSAQLKPGDRLPTEAELSRVHGVSRSVVREALHQVKSRGLLHARQGAGVFVAPPPVHQALQFDPKVLESMEAVMQVVELRRVLEGEMAALAAERATRAQVAGLKRALRAIDQAVDAGRLGVEEDFAFHRAIGEATGNPQFVRVLAFIEQYLLDAMRVTKGNEARRGDWMADVRSEHAAICAAVAAGDVDGARRAAVDHHRNGMGRLIDGGVAPRPKAARRRKAR
jgi:GntR family transcriptional regulator, transcriptional repressor for pyruvate dehydrogenase complex